MAEKATQEFGGVDVLAHNAAVRTDTSFDDLDLEALNQVLDISIVGCFNLAKAVVPSMKLRGGGNIMCVGGMSSLRGAPGRAHVMSAKMRLNAFIRGLALDLAPFDIRANQVVVGNDNTVREDNPSSAPVRPDSKNLKIPLGRMDVPQDMANLVRFLVGPGATYITGQTVHSNGGAYLIL